MLVIKSGNAVVIHKGTPASAVRRAKQLSAERNGCPRFTIMQVKVVGSYQRSATGKWYDVTPVERKE